MFSRLEIIKVIINLLKYQNISNILEYNRLKAQLLNFPQLLLQNSAH